MEQSKVLGVMVSFSFLGFTWVVEKKDGKWRIIASQNNKNMLILPGQ